MFAHVSNRTVERRLLRTKSKGKSSQPPNETLAYRRYRLLFFGGLCLALAFAIPTKLTAQQGVTSITIFVNGAGDCCATDQESLLSYVLGLGRSMEVYKSPYHKFCSVRARSWEEYYEGSCAGSGLTHDLGGNKFRHTNFANELAAFLDARRGESIDLYLIGHSWGARSLLEFAARPLHRTHKIRLLALLDPVGANGTRRSLSNYKSSHWRGQVQQLYNRWQRNTTFPFDFSLDGRILCDDTRVDCSDQKQREFVRDAQCRRNSLSGRGRVDQVGDAIAACTIGLFNPQLCKNRGSDVLSKDFGYERITHTRLGADPCAQAQLIEIIAKHMRNPGGTIHDNRPPTKVQPCVAMGLNGGCAAQDQIRPHPRTIGVPSAETRLSKTLVGPLNVRAAPSTTSPILAQLPKGQCFNTKNCRAVGPDGVYWCEIVASNGTGYVARSASVSGTPTLFYQNGC